MTAARWRGSHAGGARSRRPGRSCRSAAWGCAPAVCRRRWRGRAIGSHYGCSLSRRTAGRSRCPYGVHDLLGESAKQFLLSMAPSTKRGVANMSDLGSDKIFTEVFFVKRALGRHPYTNIFDAISYSCSNVLIRGGN